MTARRAAPRSPGHRITPAAKPPGGGSAHRQPASERSIPPKRRLLFEAAVTVLILSAYALLIAQQINLSGGDLGRHLKNGELFVTALDVPQKNLYSYVFPDYPFINHHWGSGVIFYLITQIAGFAGLSIFFIAVSAGSLLVFFRLAVRYSSFGVAAPLAVIVIPVLMTRHEVRPEVFSYLLSGVFLTLLWAYQHERLGFRGLALLPVLQVIWVNLHIYFFIGILLIAFFLLEATTAALMNKDRNAGGKRNQLALVLGLAVAGCWVNPAGLRGALYPFMILSGYEFPVIENASVWSVLNQGFNFLPLIYFQILFGVLCLSWLYAVATRRTTLSLANALIAIFFAAAAWSGIRNFALFALFALPLAAANLRGFMERPYPSSINISARLGLISTLLVLLQPIYFFSSARGERGIGLKSDNAAAAEFFVRHGIKGPIFNNYDVGAYLIYHFYPAEGVFVDNRPETYPASFFRDTYFPLVRDEARWQYLSHYYGFNAIIFNYRERSVSGEQFLVRRVLDPSWTPVFVSSDIIILVRRYGPNQAVATRHGLPYEQVLKKTR